MTVEKILFDSKSGVSQYIIRNPSKSLTVKLIDYGATITNLLVRDKDGCEKDVVLGFDSLDGYKSPLNAYFGATCGRVANRICGGRFYLNGKDYQLVKNGDGSKNHLHGGKEGFNAKLWNEEAVGDNWVTLKLVSSDGDEGYPATVAVRVTFSVTDENEVKIEYEAENLDQNLKTIINLTNNSYFNLGGADSQATAKITDHKMIMNSDVVTGMLEWCKEKSGPTGKIIILTDDSSSPSGYNFSSSNHQKIIFAIGDRIQEVNGYDDCYVLKSDNSSKYELKRNLLRVWSPVTKIQMEFSTTSPAFQLYTGEFLSDHLRSKESTQNGIDLHARSGLCIEAQAFPDAINHDEWRDQCIVDPGQKYRQETIYKFSLV